jgi:hypothetical protein
MKQRALVPDITGLFELPEAAHGSLAGFRPAAIGGFLGKVGGYVKESHNTTPGPLKVNVVAGRRNSRFDKN